MASPNRLRGARRCSRMTPACFTCMNSLGDPVMSRAGAGATGELPHNRRMSAHAKPHSSSCDRDQGLILEVLLNHFSDRKQALEIGSGTSQHAVCFGAAMPWLTWQTSDLREHHHGIGLWLQDANTLHIMGWRQVQR